MRTAKREEKPTASHKTLLEKLTSIATIVAAVFAVVFGGFQCSINSRLVALQDYVAVTAVPDGPGRIKLHNTGKVNLYLAGFETAGRRTRFRPYLLMPAGTGDVACAWITAPPKVERTGQILPVRLFIQDELGQSWISEHAIYVTKLIGSASGKTSNHYEYEIQSYKTFKSAW